MSALLKLSFLWRKVRIFTAQENDLYPQRKWSLDLYTIEKVFKPKKEYSNYTYKLEGEKEVYQNHELLKVLGEEKKVSVPERWEVSKIIRPTISKNVPSYIIKWKNYKDEYIEPRTNLDVAGYKKELAKFEKKYKQDNNIDEIYVKYTSGKNKGKWRLKKWYNFKL